MTFWYHSVSVGNLQTVWKRFRTSNQSDFGKLSRLGQTSDSASGGTPVHSAIALSMTSQLVVGRTLPRSSISGALELRNSGYLPTIWRPLTDPPIII
mmetsp:Transcript_26143/g.53687  ORF Transcript_26143/g.53687 Transcript_26143/m.53687 type:complete len:97 (-) Transcript_26143:510-800(-)